MNVPVPGETPSPPAEALGPRGDGLAGQLVALRQPLFDEPLHVGCPNLPNRERLLARIGDVLDSRWLTNRGPYVRELEQRVAELCGVKHCVAVCNATVGLELAIKAAGLSGEVIVPAFTFVATAHALQWLGITPVFCDADPATHNIDPRRVEELITPRTTGILGVHLWGRPCDVEALEAIARRHGLVLLFDAAHALGSSHRGRMVGGFGDAEVFSFHATKVLNTFEGGAVVTDDDELAGTLRLMRNFGFADYDNVVSLGTNGKMSEASGAMGVTMLEGFEAIVAVNSANHALYRRCLAGVPGVRVAEYDEREHCNYGYVIVEVDEREAGASRDELMELLWSENVLARRYFYPGCHRMEPYRSLLAQSPPSLPVTEWLCERVLALPTGTVVGSLEVAKICDFIRTTLGRESTGGRQSRLRVISP